MRVFYNYEGTPQPHTVLLVAFFVAAVFGCGEKRPAPRHVTPDASQASSPLRLLIVDDAELAEIIPREWSARSNTELTVIQAAGAELDSPADSTKLEADAIIFPSSFLGELAERGLIAPLPASLVDDPQWTRKDIFPLIQRREITWGQEAWSVPFGSPQLVLFYRADLFSELNEQPPSTWSEFQNIAERLEKRANPGAQAPPLDAEWRGVVQPLAPGWAGRLLLARAAAYARHRSFYSTLFDYRTMEPLIAKPPFVRALKELAETEGLHPDKALSVTPDDARHMFLAGHCGMALTWPHHDLVPAAAASRDGAPPLRVAELPGSMEVYHFGDQRWEPRAEDEDGRVPLLGTSGRLGAIVRSSRRKRSAANLLAWLSGAEWSGLIASRSPATTLFRQSHLTAPELWVDRQLDTAVATEYANLVATTQSRSMSLTAIRIPGQAQYMAALDDAVRKAVSGETSPEQSLNRAAEQWDQFTKSFGVDSQRHAYHHSLGLTPASRRGVTRLTPDKTRRRLDP